MAKKLVIGKCLDCPHMGSSVRLHSGINHRAQVPHCRKSQCMQLSSISTIPEWCPLEDEHPLFVYSIDEGVALLDTEMETESPVADAHGVYRPASCPFCNVTPGVRVLGDEFVEVTHPEGSCVYGDQVFPTREWPPANNDTHCTYPVCRCTVGEDKVCPRGLPDLEYKSASVPRALY